MGTVTSVGSGNYNTGSTWSSGARPGSSDDVVIASGHTVTLVQDENANSLKSESGSTIVGGGFTITIDGQALGSAANIDGEVDAGSALNLTITTAAATVLDVYPSSGKITNLTINHASCVATLGAFTPILGNLTITAGELNTDASNNYALTVAGHTAISSGGTLTLNASTCTFTGFLRNQGVFTGGSGTHTFGNGLRNDNNMTLTSGETRITGRGTGSLPDGNSTICFDDQGGTMNNGSGTINIGNGGDLGGTTNIRPSTSHDLNNVIINTTNSRTVKLESDCDIAGDLTLTAGTFDTSTSNRALTVTGACTLNGGTFTGNASTVSHGSLTISSGTYNASSGTTTLNGTVDVGMRVDGTFNNNDGTFVIDGSITKVQMGSIGGAPTGFSINNAPFHHLTINDSINFAWATGTLFNVEGDLIVAAGQTLGANNENSGIKVLGDVTLNGTLGNSNLTNDCEFGSLTINSGGTYNATSGTTTITNKSSSNYMFFDLGTFTHNNGTVHFKADTSSGTWYAVKGHSTEDTTEFYNFTTERVGSSVGNYRVCVGGSNQFLTVRNNLTVGANCKIFSGNGSSILRQSGLATLNGELDLDNFTDIEMGAVTINSGGTLEFDNGSITLKAESFRNVGGTINA